MAPQLLTVGTHQAPVSLERTETSTYDALHLNLGMSPAAQ